MRAEIGDRIEVTQSCFVRTPLDRWGVAPCLSDVSFAATWLKLWLTAVGRKPTLAIRAESQRQTLCPVSRPLLPLRSWQPRSGCAPRDRKSTRLNSSH